MPWFVTVVMYGPLAQAEPRFIIYTSVRRSFVSNFVTDCTSRFGDVSREIRKRASRFRDALREIRGGISRAVITVTIWVRFTRDSQQASRFRCAHVNSSDTNRDLLPSHVTILGRRRRVPSKYFTHLVYRTDSRGPVYSFGAPHTCEYTENGFRK